jgi:uncharacterized membrane protein
MIEDAGSSASQDGPRLRRTARLEAFSDGVFAIAITLLVLDLAIPSTQDSARHLLEAIGDEWPGYLGYVVSFSTVGALWLGHSAITDYLAYADTTLMRLNLLLLFVVSFLPFPTRLLADFATTTYRAERVAVTFYGLTLFAAGVLLSLLWRYSARAGLIRPDTSDQEITLLSSRLTPGLGGYAVLIVIGLFAPVVAIIGYLVIAAFFLLPIRIHRR